MQVIHSQLKRPTYFLVVVFGYFGVAVAVVVDVSAFVLVGVGRILNNNLQWMYFVKWIIGDNWVTTTMNYYNNNNYFYKYNIVTGSHFVVVVVAVVVGAADVVVFVDSDFGLVAGVVVDCTGVVGVAAADYDSVDYRQMMQGMYSNDDDFFQNNLFLLLSYSVQNYDSSIDCLANMCSTFLKWQGT